MLKEYGLKVMNSKGKINLKFSQVPRSKVGTCPKIPTDNLKFRMQNAVFNTYLLPRSELEIFESCFLHYSMTFVKFAHTHIRDHDFGHGGEECEWLYTRRARSSNRMIGRPQTTRTLVIAFPPKFVQHGIYLQQLPFPSREHAIAWFDFWSRR